MGNLICREHCSGLVLANSLRTSKEKDFLCTKDESYTLRLGSCVSMMFRRSLPKTPSKQCARRMENYVCTSLFAT